MNSNKRSRGRPVGTGLDDGPTLKKVADMTNAGVQLVVPAGIADTFPKDVRPHLQTLESFIGDVRLLPVGVP